MNFGLVGAAYRFGRSLRRSPRSRGDLARDAGDWLAAIEAYEAHLADEPEDGPIWIQLGHAYKEDGDLDDAERAYARATALRPDDADLFLSIGHLQKLRGRIVLALRAYETSAALEPALFGGAAMIAIEQTLARLSWRRDTGDVYSVPADIPELLAAVDAAERGGRRLFQDYYRSFEMR